MDKCDRQGMYNKVKEIKKGNTYRLANSTFVMKIDKIKAKLFWYVVECFSLEKNRFKLFSYLTANLET